MSLRRVKVHVPAHDAMPESVRGVASEIVCGTCGATLRGRTHAEARKALRFHRLEQHAAQPREAASAARETGAS